jgi:DNA/RNA endonuclease G (NUC1)
MRMRRAHLSVILVVAVLCALGGRAGAGEGFDNCAAAFPGDSLAQAPKRTHPTAATTADSVSLCYHQSGTTFFALDYSVKRLNANWVAHKLENSFGDDGCRSIVRESMQCYFSKEPSDLDDCIATGDGTRDPFHTDATLTTLAKPRIAPSTFSGTGHDQGHLAPNQSFSWHICRAYKNMAPQLARLNRGLWASLEQQVLFWAVKEGPLYVDDERGFQVMDGLIRPLRR